jgi:thioredoxin reductase (NADPH)
MAATIQLVRAGHEVQVFERGRVGGTLWNARWVDNYPGFPGGISGVELANLMEKQFLGYIGNIIINEVDDVVKTGEGFSIMGMDFDGVVICVGTCPNKAEFPGEDELAEAGLLYYGIADVRDWSGVGDVAVIGGGEASMDMAVNIAMAGISTTLLYRSNPTGIMALREQAYSEGGITWLEEEVEEGRVGPKATLKTNVTEHTFDRVIVAVGRQTVMPKFVGFSLENPPLGLLIAGDATRGSLGQVATAVGDGVEMAMILSRYLEALD